VRGIQKGRGYTRFEMIEWLGKEVVREVAGDSGGGGLTRAHHFFHDALVASWLDPACAITTATCLGTRYRLHSLR